MRMKARIIYLIPGSENDPVSMVFAKRQVNDLSQHVEAKIYFIKSRLNPFSLIHDYLNLLIMCLKFRPKLIHAQYGTVTSFLGAMIPCVPLVMNLRGSDIDPSPRGGGYFRKLIAVFLSQISAVIAKKIILVSEHQAKKIFQPSKAVVIPSGIDLNMYQKASVDEIREELGWKKNELYIYFNAGKEPLNKRLDLAEFYFSELKKKFHNLNLIVLRGETPPDLARKMMGASDVVFMTSEREGSPNVVKEALALGVPVVAHEVGDVSQVLKLDNFSTSVALGDEESFLASARRILIEKPRGQANLISLSSVTATNKILSVYSDVSKCC
jgi:teichuronic acid biosynthesis glycosyltransferase TuaC